MTTQDDFPPLPCPFCGHVGLSFAEGGTFRWLAFSCAGCGMGDETRIQTTGNGTPEQWRRQAEIDAINAWNKRDRAARSAAVGGAWPADVMQRLKDAIEGECEGLALDDFQARHP